MSYSGALNLTTVQVAREALTADGMGGATVSTTLTTLSKAAIWQNSSSAPYLSDQLMAISSHVLACMPTDDVLTSDKVVYGGDTYEVVGRPDNVLFKGEAQFVPLKLVNQ